MHRPTPRAVYYLLGGTAVGAVGFAVFAGLGKGEQGDLEKSCSPFCASADTDSVNNKYLAADISLGLGVAALVAAGIVYFTRPKVPVENEIADESEGETASGRRRSRWSLQGGRFPGAAIRF